MQRLLISPVWSMLPKRQLMPFVAAFCSSASEQDLLDRAHWERVKTHSSRASIEAGYMLAEGFRGPPNRNIWRSLSIAYLALSQLADTIFTGKFSVRAFLQLAHGWNEELGIHDIMNQWPCHSFTTKRSKVQGDGAGAMTCFESFP